MIPDDDARVLPLAAAPEAEATPGVAVCRLCPLSRLDCGVDGRVIDVSGAPHLRRRLLALGLRPGTACCVLGRSPARGPIHVRAGTVHLMLRAREADDVTIGVDETTMGAVDPAPVDAPPEGTLRVVPPV